MYIYEVLHDNTNLENHFYQKYTPLMEAVYIQRLDMVQFITQEIKNKRNNEITEIRKSLRYLKKEKKESAIGCLEVN